ncbi:MAG TPA: CAP domain-containing protein [Solirubrobacteraceae bacterium]|nr:CAP domain-containing protein [Solirubrobacteraceae bacterium]
MPTGAAAATRIASATGVCLGADLVPAPTNLTIVAAATLCLINEQRADAGVGPLRANAELAAAAIAHSADMVASDYFDHVSPSGQAPIDRITAAGYGGADGAVSVGENIAAVGDPATPDAVVAMWMTSPAHRANILDPDYRDSGIGVAPGLPASVGGGPGATFTEDLGATD